MNRVPGAVRRVLAEPGTPYGRLAVAGLLGLASAAATIGLLAGSGYVVGRAALQPGLNALVGILAAVEVLAFLRGPLRYAERLVGHDAALRALATWRVWLYDRLTARVPAALAGWRSGDLLARAVDDVDALADLYLRTGLPVAIAVGAGALGTVVVGLILPWAALALGLPLAVALVIPTVLTWRRGGDQELVELSGTLSAHVVDALAGAPELLAFGADEAWVAAAVETGTRAEVLERRHARRTLATSLLSHLCMAVAVGAVLALGVAAVHAHRLGPVMVAVLPLAVLATFETVPSVPLAAARGLAVRAAAERLFAIDAVPVPVNDVADPDDLPLGVPSVAFEQASVRYDPALPPRTRPCRRSHPARRSGRRHWVERIWQVDPRQRAPALLAPRRGPPRRGREGHRSLQTVRGAAVLRIGRPAGPDVLRHRPLQRHAGPTGRHRGGDRRGTPGRVPRPLGVDTPRRARHPSR